MISHGSKPIILGIIAGRKGFSASLCRHGALLCLRWGEIVPTRSSLGLVRIVFLMSLCGPALPSWLGPFLSPLHCSVRRQHPVEPRHGANAGGQWEVCVLVQALPLCPVQCPGARGGAEQPRGTWLGLSGAVVWTFSDNSVVGTHCGLQV